eukprot:TRINITY_DN4481_c0_g2_i1.p1 TRINITY_DN4481_c0_g2~~TRINITY_DN4481_c0_g2_i1.p1  ORF type:complete len:1246 (+),score=307.28 TRINITY_DN4481_c0_g2_i1:137-3739(+)
MASTPSDSEALLQKERRPSAATDAEPKVSEEAGSRVWSPVSLVAMAGLLGCVLFLASRFLYHFASESAAANLTPLMRDRLETLDEMDIRPIKDKPQGDTRSYQFATLANGLRVINIRDPTATQAAFSVAVNAGSLDNPVKLPGLAHFCEHMLFLGTKTYPDPKGFDKFVSEAGGYNNAFTADEHTVYFTEVSIGSGGEAESRLADFFRAPLFDETYVAKEVQAINSEHAKNVQDQDRVVFEIFGALSDPASPASRFKTGNTETLETIPKKEGINPVEALRSWNKEHYCPSRFRLATFGPQSLEQQLVQAQTYFGNISKGSEQCQKPRRSWSTPKPWPKDRLGKFISIEGMRPQAEIWIHFPLPDVTKDYKSNPLSYINYVVSYGGENSLTNVLQDKLGLISSFGLSGSGGSPGYDMFLVAKLTDKGREKYEAVLDMIFQYLGNVQRHGVDGALYLSLANVYKLEWDWSETPAPADTVSAIAEQMFTLPPQDILSGGSRIDKLDDARVAELMALMNPGNMNIAIVDQEAKKSLFKGQEVQTLPYYGAKYAETELAQQLPGAVDRWSSYMNVHDKEGAKAIEEQLRKRLQDAGVPMKNFVIPVMPGQIKDVPKHLDTQHMRAAAATSAQAASNIQKLYGQRPNNLLPSGDGASSKNFEAQLWYRSGWVTKSPKMQMSVDLVMPRKADSFEVPAEDALKLSLYGSLLGQEMNPKMYDLSMTGVSYAVSFSPHSISFSFGGFSPLMPEMMTRVLNECDRGVNVTDPDRYNRAVEETRQALKTFADMPITYAITDRNLLLTPGMRSREEQLAALEKLTPQSVAASVKELILPKPLRPTFLVMGNLNEKEAQEAYQKIDKRTKTWPGANKKPEADEEVRLVVPVVKPSKPIELRRLNQRPGDPNHNIVVSYLTDVSTVENRVVFGLISSVLHNVAYSTLRTDMQLGYVVNAGISPLSNVQYVSCVVQGDKLDADKMEGAVEKVYSKVMPETLANMTDEEFSSHKRSLRESLLQPPSTTKEEFSYFLSPITEGGNCWNMRDEMLSFLDSKDVTKELLLRTWQSIILPTQGIRNRMVVKHFPGSVPERPTKEQTLALWKEYGVPDAAISLLQREYDAAVMLDKADSSTRMELLQSGSYYPTTLNCQRKASLAEGLPFMASLLETEETLIPTLLQSSKTDGIPTAKRRAGGVPHHDAAAGASFLSAGVE